MLIAININSALNDVPEDTRKIFISYHRNHPQIWHEFEKFALRAAQKNKTFGAKAIMERVRYEMEIEKNEEYKINNNFVSYYARIFTHKYPQYKGLFEFRFISGLKEIYAA